jgi:signal transduction histidine kinase
MFQSATFKLTAWYAVIIIAISLLFSALIYSIASTEVGSQIDYYLQRTSRLPSITNQNSLEYLHDLQVQRARNNLLGALFVTNVCIWIAGAIGSYHLAKRTLRPIQEAHEAQSRFTSDVSHELRTPLASMKVELEVALRDQNLKKDEMRELLGSSLEEVNKLTNLTQTLLQLSQLDHDSITREKVTLAKITPSVIARFKADHRIKLHPSTQAVHVFANKAGVEELLTILIDNALKYSSAKSEINVAFIKQKNMSGFKVVNTGEGIPADILPHIFDRFYRVDPSRTGGKKKGYGLGLSLAKKIVELHDGELTVSSAPKHETTFQVLLPNFSNSKAENK